MCYIMCYVYWWRVGALRAHHRCVQPLQRAGQVQGVWFGSLR
uniref:Uncharacterized protein n=1 Tax=Setaria italica TaxID=4555 RepID=K3YFJ8_SETIT